MPNASESFSNQRNKKKHMARYAYIATPNTNSIVTTAECKTHLRVDYSDDDTYIANLALAAKETIEDYTNRKLFATNVIQYCDTWNDAYLLYFSPISDITRVEYYNTSNVLTTLSTDVYDKNIYGTPSTITLAPSKTFPAVAERARPILVKYTAGYADASSVPMALKQACLILVAQWYENRLPYVQGRIVSEIPMTATYLMNRYKVYGLGMDYINYYNDSTNV